MTSFGLTHAGPVKQRNEDRFLVKEYAGESVLLAVADGMGGHAAGDRAAEMACRGLQAFDADVDSGAVAEQLQKLVRRANRGILEAARRDPSLEGMGTTLTVVFVDGRTARWVHAGDSRLSLWRNHALTPITNDHSYPGMLLKDGELTPEEARTHPMRNLLLNCLGRSDPELEAGEFGLEPGDLLLLSTDGLHDWLSETAMVGILGGRSGLEEKLEGLLQAALAAGGRDDITAVAVQL